MRPIPAKILVTESSEFSPRAANLLRQLGLVQLADLSTRSELLQSISDFDVLWVRLRHKIDLEVMARASSLRAIVSPTTGLNHIDLAEAERRHIHILSLKGETDFLRGIRATSEHTVALVLALMRHIPAATQHVLGDGWDRDMFKGHELFGKTAGIVGYGRVGQQVARYLLAFGMHVLISDPQTQFGALEPGIACVRLEDLLSQSNLVTIHVNYTPENHRIFGTGFFSVMKEGSWFVNTSRGELIDEEALLAALKTQHLAGAALDVLSDEDRIRSIKQNPLIEHARQARNLLISPHIGGCTFESMEKTEDFMAEKLDAYLRTWQ